MQNLSPLASKLRERIEMAEGRMFAIQKFTNSYKIYRACAQDLKNNCACSDRVSIFQC